MKFLGSFVPEPATNHENLTTKYLSYKYLYILTALCLYLILLWCSILTLVRLDATNAMIKSIGNERRHRLLLSDPRIISNASDGQNIGQQDEYLNPPIAASVARKENTVNSTLDNDVQKTLNKSNNITKANVDFNAKSNKSTLPYYMDKFGKIINQTIKTAETIKLLHDSFYKNTLRLDNDTQLDKAVLNNTVKMVGIDDFQNYSKHSPLLEIIELSKNELLEPIAESDQSHILSLIKSRNGGTITPKNVGTTIGKPFVNKTKVVKKNVSRIKNVISKEIRSNFTLKNSESTTETAIKKEIILMQGNVSDPVIKYIIQSNKSEAVNETEQNKIYKKSSNINNDTVMNKSIHSEDSKYTSAKPTSVTLDNRNHTTPGNVQIENEAKKIFSSVRRTSEIKHDTLDKYNFDSSIKPSTDNAMEIGSNLADKTGNVERDSFDIHNSDDNITASTTIVPTATNTDVKAVISSKYDPAWRNKSLSAIGIKIGNKSAKQTILYSKHAPTNLTVLTEKPKETSNEFKIPSLRERLGQLSNKRYRLRKVTINQNVSPLIQTTTSPPSTTLGSTNTTSSAAWILYNGTHRLQEEVTNYYTEPREDLNSVKMDGIEGSSVTANQKLLQGLSSSHIEFLYDFDRIPTPASSLNAEQSFYSNNENVALGEQVMNGHQSNFAERMHFDLFHSVPKVSPNKPLKPACEHKNIELFAEYDDNIGQYSSHNGEIRRDKRDMQRVKSLTEFENLIMNLTMLVTNGQNDTETNEDDSDDLWNYNTELVLLNFTRAMEMTTGKSFDPSTEVTSEVAQLTFDDILNGKLSEKDTVAIVNVPIVNVPIVNVPIVNVPTQPQVNSSVQPKLKSKRKPYSSHRKLKPIKLENKITHSLNKTEVNNRNQSSVSIMHSSTEKHTTLQHIAPARKKVVQKLQKPKLITPEAVEITVESKGHTAQASQTAQNITTDLAKLMMVLLSKTEDLD